MGFYGILTALVVSLLTFHICKEHQFAQGISADKFIVVYGTEMDISYCRVYRKA